MKKSSNSKKRNNKKHLTNEGKFLTFLKIAFFVCLNSLPKYSHKKSKHTYLFPSLIACSLLKLYIKNLDWRGLEELLKSSSDMQKILGWERVPDHSTLHRAFQKLQEEQIQKLFLQVLKFFKPSGILSCDSTGLREDSASFYFSIRSKKIRRRWIKLIYLVDTKTQACLSQVVARGPGYDARYLEILEKQNPFKAWLEIMDRGFDGKGNFRLKFTLPFRIIPPISRGGRIKSFGRIMQRLIYVLSVWLGIYGKRWISETVNYVIKRKIGESLRERREDTKRKMALLIGIAYNIHVMIRDGKAERILFFEIRIFIVFTIIKYHCDKAI